MFTLFIYKIDFNGIVTHFNGIPTFLQFYHFIVEHGHFHGLPEGVYICVFWAKSARSGGLSLYICNFVSKVGEMVRKNVRKVFQVGEYMQNFGKNRAKVEEENLFYGESTVKNLTICKFSSK